MISTVQGDHDFYTDLQRDVREEVEKLGAVETVHAFEVGNKVLSLLSRLIPNPPPFRPKAKSARRGGSQI